MNKVIPEFPVPPYSIMVAIFRQISSNKIRIWKWHLLQNVTLMTRKRKAPILYLSNELINRWIIVYYLHPIFYIFLWLNLFIFFLGRPYRLRFDVRSHDQPASILLLRLTTRVFLLRGRAASNPVDCITATIWR